MKKIVGGLKEMAGGKIMLVIAALAFMAGFMQWDDAILNTIRSYSWAGMRESLGRSQKSVKPAAPNGLPVKSPEFPKFSLQGFSDITSMQPGVVMYGESSIPTLSFLSARSPALLFAEMERRLASTHWVISPNIPGVNAVFVLPKLDSKEPLLARWQQTWDKGVFVSCTSVDSDTVIGSIMNVAAIESLLAKERNSARKVVEIAAHRFETTFETSFLVRDLAVESRVLQGKRNLDAIHDNLRAQLRGEGFALLSDKSMFNEGFDGERITGAESFELLANKGKETRHYLAVNDPRLPQTTTLSQQVSLPLHKSRYFQRADVKGLLASNLRIGTK